MGWFRRVSPRRSQVRKRIPPARVGWLSGLTKADNLISALIWCVFVLLCVPILGFELILDVRYLDLALTAGLIVLVCLGAVFYIYNYQKRIIRNHLRASILAILFLLMLAAAKIAVSLFHHTAGATVTAITTAIILSITYDQRFAIGMSLVYCLLAVFTARTTTQPVSLAAYELAGMDLLLTMAAGAVVCCLSLREIRTRMKLLNVSALAAAVVFATALALGLLGGVGPNRFLFSQAGYHAAGTFLVGLVIQSLLPLIEKVFRVATSMTLLDYSDANQPLLKRLAMEAPGTFSHSLLVGSIAEAAAEAIGRNGLLCRVGAYYHDIGKINKAGYFVENEMGSASKHKELTPAMSQLIIVGHVKDGIELAKEYGLPTVLRQFIETHHGTTLIEHFYNEAKKQARNNKGKGSEMPLESEFRYPGPKPRTKEAAIVMLADAVEGAVKSLGEVSPAKIETVVHNLAMKRLQDGQFDECDLTLRELSQIEASISKTLTAHYHSRIAYPQPPDVPVTDKFLSRGGSLAERR